MYFVDTRTQNGALAHNSTLDHVLDFFYLAGAARGKNIIPALSKALVQDTELTLRAVLWLRDAREGAGERETFRNCLKYLISQGLGSKILPKIPEIGRFDDLKVFWNTELETPAALLWLNQIRKGNALAAKWAPVKDKKGAKPLRKLANMNEASWRKFIVSLRDTVEQKMCAGEWEDINFSAVPSVASARYTAAFQKNSKAYAKYKEALASGEAKINASAIFPHDVLKACLSGDKDVASAQWKTLPNYLEDSVYSRVLPVVDVSGSMTFETISGSTTPLDVAISLGIYCSEHAKGHFKDKFMTFSKTPELLDLRGSLKDKVDQLTCANWGMNTDLVAVFDLILASAIRHKVPQNEMPQVVLIPSDMEFDCCGNEHLLPLLSSKFAGAGYDMPGLVFWNLSGSSIPATKTDNGTALISGFSPSILTSVLSGDLDPISIMLKTLGKERYEINLI